MAWAFQNLMNMIDNGTGRKLIPTTILTDADHAASEALKIIFPNIHHFRCSWHLLQNLVKKCKGHFSSAQWKQFVRRFQRAAFAKTLAHFELRWKKLMRVSRGVFTTALPGVKKGATHVRFKLR